jgi:hypothetical protein
MRNQMLAALTLIVAHGFSGASAQGRSEQLLSNTTLNGREMAVSRTRLAGQLRQIVSQYYAAWSQGGPVQRSSMGEWELLSRPHARGIELLQFRENRGGVELLSSVLVLPSNPHTLKQPAVEHSHFLRALQLPSNLPMLKHGQEGQLTLNAASQLSMAPAAAFEHVRSQAKQQDWQIEFERFDASKGGVLLLKGPQGERVNATLHAHQLGSALVVQESRPQLSQGRQ